MKPRVEDWDESILDMEDYQVERALANAALDAIHRARRFGTDFVVEEDGKPLSLRPNETAPYEERLLNDLERLNGKIAAIEARQSSALALNDKPKKQ